MNHSINKLSKQEFSAYVEANDIDDLYKQYLAYGFDNFTSGRNQAKDEITKHNADIKIFWETLALRLSSTINFLIALSIISLIGYCIYLIVLSNVKQGAYERGACARGDTSECQRAVDTSESSSRSEFYKAIYFKSTGKLLPLLPYTGHGR